MEVSFTKINDDVMVPTHLYEAKDSLPLSAHSWFWWGLGGLWAFGLFTGAKFGWQGIVLITGISLAIALPFAFVMKLPFGWIELNRKEGTVTAWTSPKKRRRLAKGDFADYRADWIKRRVLTSKYSADYRYTLTLSPLTGKKRGFFLNVIKTKDAVCFLCDVATFRANVLPPENQAEQTEKLTRKVEVFLNDFFAGKPLRPTKNNVYRVSA